MDHRNNYIVFQCYGHERIFFECAYALLSLSRVYKQQMPANLEIWIYTDNPDWFKAFNDCNLPLHYRQIDKATIQQWRGKIDFVHRVKIEILKDFTTQRKGNVLYVDTDVVFTQPIDKMLQDITNGTLYMHTMESVISQEANPILKKLSRFLKKENKTLNGKPQREMAMWNAGVLGFNTRYTNLLDAVLAYTDSEYPQFPKHVVEQFAFSIYFQSEGALKAAEAYIYHYWNLKEAGAIIASFFNHFKDKSWEELTNLSSLVQLPELMQEKTDFYAARGLFGKLQGKQWTPVMPDWAALLNKR